MYYARENLVYTKRSFCNKYPYDIPAVQCKKKGHLNRTAMGFNRKSILKFDVLYFHRVFRC